MTKEFGTLKELGVQVGDVVEMVDDQHETMEVHECAPREESYAYSDHWRLVGEISGGGLYKDELFRIVSRSHREPKLWRDMTPEEKGALLLARHEGKAIEVDNGCGWEDSCYPFRWGHYAYRVKPDPKVETEEFSVFYNVGFGVEVVSGNGSTATHHITFNTIDGKPDCASIKMEEV